MELFAYLGIATAGLLALGLLFVLKELAWLVYRAALQTSRYVGVARDLGYKLRLRDVLRFFRKDVFDSYTEIRIDNITLPRDPRQPTGESYPG